MFGKSINSNEFSRGVFESNEVFSSVPLGVIFADLVSRHYTSSGQNWTDNANGKPIEKVSFQNCGSKDKLELVE